MAALYELTTLSLDLLAAEAVSAGAHRWVTAPDALGTFVGCWRTEIGTLGRLLVLRGCAGMAAQQEERRRALLSPHPFGAERAAGEHLGGHLDDRAAGAALAVEMKAMLMTRPTAANDE